MLALVSGTIQWRCGVCNSQNPVGSGGICVRCRKFACNRHLNVVSADGKRIKVCDSCLTVGDEVQKGLKGILGRWFGNKA
ncbi:MAG: hypothetical protein M0023_07045 [Desulfobacteraceae bacterium]|nr:hypothetical protein [Desulfobacteraceae bacterium]